jgi:hypothetical protein
MDILYLWTFCGRTFCRGGRFVSMDVLYMRTFSRKDVLSRRTLCGRTFCGWTFRGRTFCTSTENLLPAKFVSHVKFHDLLRYETCEYNHFIPFEANKYSLHIRFVPNMSGAP